MTEHESTRIPDAWSRFEASPFVKFFSSDFIRNFATLSAVAFAVVSLNRTVRLQERLVERQISVSEQQFKIAAEQAGNASWERFVEVAINKPKMAAGLNLSTLNRQDVVAYQWFVERMLFAGEQILYATRDDPQWHASIAIETERHLDLLRTEYFTDFDFCTYRKEIRNLLIEVDNENYKNEARFLNIRCNPKFVD